MIKLLIGGSPCTYWSIAQKNNRETEPSGLGWELFKNYLIAKEKFQPDFFLYENNKSAAQAIKDEIKRQLKVWDGTLLMEDTGARYIEINSALVSAQNRQRFYVHNCGEVEQPKDRGILLRDILESGVVEKDKGYCLKHQAGNVRDYFKKHHTNIKFESVAEPINATENDEKARTLMAGYYKYGTATLITNEGFKGGTTAVAEPVCVAQRGRYSDSGNRSKKGDGEIEQYYEAREGGKTNALTTVQKDNMVAEPVAVDLQVVGRKRNNEGEFERSWEARTDGKSSALTSVESRRMVAEPVRVADINNGGQGDRIYSVEGKAVAQKSSSGGAGGQTGLYVEPIRIGDIGSDAQAHRVYSCDGKSRVLIANAGGQGRKTGLYACPVNITEKGKSQTVKAQYSQTSIANICCYSSTYGATGVAIPTEEKPTPFLGKGKDKDSMRRVYEVKNGKITIKDKQYPIKLADGFYIIRKLTVTECCRLQTMPDDYCRARIEKVKEIVLKCKDVPTQIVTIPLQTEKQGCAINTTFDLKEMEVQNLKDQNLTPHCLALSRGVIDIDKHIWDIVLCTIKDLQEKEQQDWLEAIMNMCKATMSADLSIEKLPKECWDENLKKEKSSTILTLIQKIIAKITSMFVPQKNTHVFIESCAENCLSTSPTSLTVGTLYSTEKNMKLVSESACYKGLGNGWTAEVIIHILNGALKNVPKDEKIVVLSMYDGIGTGRYCLDKMGFTNVEYHAYEIDKYAIQIAMSNYPDIIQHGDAYQVRENNWELQ